MDLMIALATVGVIGYALYYVFTEQEGGRCLAAQSFKEARAAAPAGPAASVASVAASVAPVAAVQRVAEPPAKPAVQPAPPQATPAPAVTAPAPAAARRPAEVTMLRDPQTGETAAVPSNYRFAKKWVKEALVTEGLLDKVYKNNELDEAASEKIKAALEQLKGLAKYQA